MIILLKAFGILVSVIIAILAMLFVIASGLAINNTDSAEQRDAMQTALTGLVVFALCAFAILSLSGCEAARAIMDACKSGDCR